MKRLKILGDYRRLTPEDRREFNRFNALFNSEVTMILSLLVIILLSVSMLIGYMSQAAGAEGVDEFWIIFPYHITVIALSIIVFISTIIIRRKNASHLVISDIISITQVCMIMLVFLVSAHVEIPATGIKNINVTIIVMFSFGIFLRFRIKITLVLELLFTIACGVFLVLERNDIPNYYPSLVNLICAFAFSSFAAFMYWNSRLSNFVSTKKLEFLASSDHLTRLHNRRSFDAFMEQEWERASEESICMSLFFIDADSFKKYNDLYGHAEGDRCLCAIADAISASIRKNDFAARYGGEEFVVALPGINGDTAARIANKMLDTIRSKQIIHADSVTPYVTMSIGCMICRPDKRGGTSMKEFIQKADDALYMAKEQGRNRLVIHPEALITTGAGCETPPTVDSVSITKR